jgi:hypothetical protein
LIREYYGAEVPSYGVITCTAILPSCRSEVDRVDVASSQHRLHHARHNPEMCFGKPECWPDQVKLLVDQKRREIAVACDPGIPDPRRKAAWESIHTINQRLWDCASSSSHLLERMPVQAEDLRSAHRIQRSREYFFGLFPESELRALADSVGFFVSGDV